jgi:hypothetical protein
MVIQNDIRGDLGVTYGAPIKAVLNSYDDIAADAVRPVPTLLFATINISVVLTVFAKRLFEYLRYANLIAR